jgi:hypothetical protein
LAAIALASRSGGEVAKKDSGSPAATIVDCGLRWGFTRGVWTAGGSLMEERREGQESI